MKIVILSQTFPLHRTDATAHFMYDFCRGFEELGHDAHILLPYHKKLRLNEFKGLKIHTFKYIWPDNFHLLGFGRSLIGDQRLSLFAYLLAPFYFLFGTLVLLRIIKKEKIDVVNAHWIIPNGFLAAVVCKITRTPLIITLPGSDVYLVKKNFLFGALAQFVIGQAKEVVSNSPQLLADLKVKGKVISYGVPINDCDRLLNKTMVIATAGRRVEKKGFEFLTSVYPEVEIISGLPIDQFRKKLQSVDIFLVPSTRDSAGNLDDASLVVLEAMAAGCAVVVSDLPGYRKIIKNGQNGLLVGTDDKRAWQKAVEMLKRVSAKRFKLSASARETIASGFTPEKIARKYLKIFKA